MKESVSTVKIKKIPYPKVETFSQPNTDLEKMSLNIFLEGKKFVFFRKNKGSKWQRKL